MREAFVFYASFYEAIKDLDAEEYKQTVNALCEYALNDNELETSGIAKLIITMAKPQIDANNKRYENGKKGGRPRKNDKEKTMVKNKKTNGLENENQRLLNKKPKEKEKEKEKVKDKVKGKDNVNEFSNQFENVVLTQVEYDKLVEKFGKGVTDEALEYLHYYKLEKDYKTKSDYLTIRRWVISAVQERASKQKQVIRLPESMKAKPQVKASKESINAINEKLKGIKA